MADQPSYPIVLAHGIARFDFLLAELLHTFDRFGLDLSLPTDGLNYFKGIAGHLRDNGFDVYHSSVSFAASVERRAADLRDEINKVLGLKDSQKVHIIAHSMGGLDARHMIVNLGMADQVASLTTVGTPHLGTSFADWGLAHDGHDLIQSLKRVLDLGGFADLTMAACALFNEAARDQEAKNGVLYQTYASSEGKTAVYGPLQGSWEIVDREEGDNDGLVSVTSQRWQARLVSSDGVTKAVCQNTFPVPADHLNEVGWWELQELRAMDLFAHSLTEQIESYELSIRNVYLEIARTL